MMIILDVYRKPSIHAKGKVAISDMKVCECPKGALYIDKNRPCPKGCPELPGVSSVLRS
jgi:hypothetical protein